LQKKKSGVKKCLEICAIKGGGGGGVGPLMANAIKNFHFDYLNTSLIKTVFKWQKAGFETKMHIFLVNHVSLHETVASSFRETEESQ